MPHRLVPRVTLPVKYPKEMGKALQNTAPEGAPRGELLLHWQLGAESLPCHSAIGTGCAQGEHE